MFLTIFGQKTSIGPKVTDIFGKTIFLRPKPSEYVPEMGVFYVSYEETYPPRALVSAIEAQNRKSPKISKNEQKWAKNRP